MNGQTKERELEEILAGLGDPREKGFPVFRCLIGDSRYLHLTQRLKQRLEHINEIEGQNQIIDLREIAAMPSRIQRRRELAIHNRFKEAICPYLGLDYGDWLNEQLKTAQKYTPGSLTGLSFQLADPHVHAHDFIKETLNAATTKVAIVRFDTHDDRRKSLENKTHWANYFSQIVLDDTLAEKISRVVTTCGIANETMRYTVNGVHFVTAGIFRLPEIEEPAIIDIDLDGCEDGGINREFKKCMPGGHIYNHSSFAYYNQDNIKLHPRAAARVLKTQVKNPLKVAVALERGYRNRLFWYRIERDFIDELCI